MPACSCTRWSGPAAGGGGSLQPKDGLGLPRQLLPIQRVKQELPDPQLVHELLQERGGPPILHTIEHGDLVQPRAKPGLAQHLVRSGRAQVLIQDHQGPVALT